MGIQGLIPFLDKASRRVNISQFKGCCVAIDAYCWLHKGAYTCADKLARGEHCDAYVFYCMKYINMLLSHDIKPILVFDGRYLPEKAGTEKKRREMRESNRKQAAELLRAGRVDDARNFLRRSIDISHEMALTLMRECRKINVDCIVAPYEADAQLAYLNIKDIAQVVITEDSDLVLFGCKKILFKMDLIGNGVLVEKDLIHLAMGVRFENYKFDIFRYMCILSGCDYLPSLPGIGLIKAHKFFTRTIDPDLSRALTRIPAHLNMPNLKVTQEYREDFLRADATFKYQLVYDPLSRSMVPLTEHPDKDVFVGEKLPRDVAFQLALGNLDPFTMMRVDNFDPDISRAFSSRKAPHPSIWSDNYIKPLNSKETTAFVSTTKQVSFMDIKVMRDKAAEPDSVREHALSETDLTMSYLKYGHEPSTSKVGDGIPSKREYETSPILTKKYRNPFAKLSPSTAMKTNYKQWRTIGALNKFSTVYPESPEPHVRSRYFAMVEILPRLNESTSNHSEIDPLSEDEAKLMVIESEVQWPTQSLVQNEGKACSSFSEGNLAASVTCSAQALLGVQSITTSIGQSSSAFKWTDPGNPVRETSSHGDVGQRGSEFPRRGRCRKLGLSKSSKMQKKIPPPNVLSRFGFKKWRKM